MRLSQVIFFFFFVALASDALTFLEVSRETVLSWTLRRQSPRTLAPHWRPSRHFTPCGGGGRSQWDLCPGPRPNKSFKGTKTKSLGGRGDGDDLELKSATSFLFNRQKLFLYEQRNLFKVQTKDAPIPLTSTCI